MSKLQSNFHEFLRSFFDNEIYFLSSKSLQCQVWSVARGEQFGARLLLSLEAWHTILQHRKKFNLTFDQFDQIQKLFDLLKEFQISRPCPTQPQEYQALLNNSEWGKIQQYADQLYNCIGKFI